MKAVDIYISMVTFWLLLKESISLQFLTKNLTENVAERFRANFLNAVHVRQSLTCTIGLANDLIDGGQPRAKPHLGKMKLNFVLKTVFSSRLATVYQVVG